MGCAAALVSWAVAGSAAGLSALIGAGAYFVPNALFASRLLLGLFGARRPSPFAFFLGEAFKLGLAVLLLGLAADLGRNWLVWPAFLRSEEHTSELQSLMRISYAVFCLKKKNINHKTASQYQLVT